MRTGTRRSPARTSTSSTDATAWTGGTGVGVEEGPDLGDGHLRQGRGELSRELLGDSACVGVQAVELAHPA